MTRDTYDPNVSLSSYLSWIVSCAITCQLKHKNRANNAISDPGSILERIDPSIHIICRLSSQEILRLATPLTSSHQRQAQEAEAEEVN
jgi:hypothetical protein